MSWWGIINPSAGGGGDVRDRVTRALAAVGLHAELRESDSADHVPGLVAAAVEAGASGVIAVGGDGTVNLVADALLHLRPQDPPILGILPAGSGCDFIRTFGIPQDLESAARHLAGELTLDDAARLMKRDTRRFAKRQLTWLRKEAGLIRLHPDEHGKAASLAQDFLSRGAG